MANVTSTINVLVPIEVKEEATKIFNNLGLNMSTAMNIFLKKVIQERGIPFELKEPTPSKELLEALQEGEQIIEDIKNGKRKGYTDVHQMFQDIIKEED